MADTLDDDFAYSDDEVYQEEAGMAEAVHGANDNTGRNDHLKASISEKSSNSKGLETKPTSQGRQDPQEGTENKKRIKRQKLRQQSAQKRNIALAAGINLEDGRPFGTLPSDVLEVYFSNVLQRHHPNLSPIEAQEYPLHAQHLLPVDQAWQLLQSEGSTPHKAAGGADMHAFLRHVLPDVASDLKNEHPPPSTVLKGAPAILIVTSDSGRAANLCAEVSSFLNFLHTSDATANPSKKQKVISSTSSLATQHSQKLKPAKLFGRHFKLEEQQAYLFANAAPIAVGTPARLRALLNEPALPSSVATALSGQSKKNKKAKGSGNSLETPDRAGLDAGDQTEAKPALNLDHLQYLIIDTTFRDKKNRNIFESDDARPETLRLLLDIHQQRKHRAEKRGHVGKETSIKPSAEERQEEGGNAHKGKQQKKRKKGAEDGNAGDAKSHETGAEERRAEKATALTRWVVLY